MRLKSLTAAVLLCVASTTPLFAAIPKAPDRAPTDDWVMIEALACEQGKSQLIFETYIRRNITTIERIDRGEVSGVRFRESHSVWRGYELLVEEVYIRSSAKGGWMFYGPIEEDGILRAMSHAWKAAGIDVNGPLTCKDKE